MSAKFGSSFKRLYLLLGVGFRWTHMIDTIESSLDFSGNTHINH